MLTFISNTFIYSLEAISFYFLLCAIINVKVMPNIKLLVSTLLFSTLYSLVDLFVPSVQIVFILQIILCFTLFSLNLSISPEKLIYPYINAFIIEMAIQFITYIPCQMLALPITQIYMQIIGIFSTLLLCIGCYFLLPLHKLYNFILHTSALTQVVLTNLFLLFVGLILYYRFHPTSPLKTCLLFITILLLSVGINAEILSTNLKLHKNQRELENYQQYLPIIEELIEQVRVRQHKFDNEIQAICALPLIHDNYDQLVNAINEHSKLCFQENLPISFLKINQKLLAAYFYQKTIAVKEKGITLNLEIKNYNLQTIVPEYELLELFGILLDNAIEATPEHEFIDITLDSQNGTILFSIANPSPPLDASFQKKIFEKGFTTKSLHPEQHGFGLYILQQKVTSYNGKITLQNTTKYHKNYFMICVEI